MKLYARGNDNQITKKQNKQSNNSIMDTRPLPHDAKYSTKPRPMCRHVDSCCSWCSGHRPCHLTEDVVCCSNHTGHRHSRSLPKQLDWADAHMHTPTRVRCTSQPSFSQTFRPTRTIALLTARRLPSYLQRKAIESTDSVPFYAGVSSVVDWSIGNTRFT